MESDPEGVPQSPEQKPAGTPPAKASVLQRPAGGPALNRPITLGSFREFFSLTGGSILYCLSALCVISGFMAMMGMEFARCFEFTGTLPVILGLNAYELALFAVLLVIILWQNVTDDAISLVVIAAVFLIVAGVALSTTALSRPKWVLLLGTGCFVLSVAKLVALRRFIRMSISPLLWTGLSVVLAWNFLAAGRLADMHKLKDVTRGDLLGAFLVLLAGAAIVLADAMRRVREWGPAEGEKTAFLGRPAMAWIVALILLVLAGAHQRGLFYVFCILPGALDFLPLVAVLLLVLIHVAMNLRVKAGYPEAVLACLPPALFLLILTAQPTFPAPAFGIELFWYPPVYLCLAGLVVLWTGMRAQCAPLAWTSALYALAAVLTLTFREAQVEDLNWCAAGALAVAGLLVAGIAWKNVNVCVVAVIAGCLGFMATDASIRLLKALGTDAFLTLLALAGAGTLVVLLAFGRRHAWLLFACGLALMVFAFDFLPRQVSLRDLWAAAVLAALIVALLLRLRHWPTIGVLAVPLAVRVVMLFLRLGSWAYVAVGFLLLFAGAVVSILKGKRAKAEAARPPEPPPPAPPEGQGGGASVP